MVNLIGNAIDEISGSSDPWIELLYNQDTNALSIKDSGPGIPEDIARNIFKVNYSTKKNKGGSGLGLAISRHTV